jgi:Pyruvate-formate lyase-activating enzyme
MNGLVTNIQRYSVNDGYGIRTIVFLAGCSMNCLWCQNPETMGSGAPVVMFAKDSCSGCGACVEACPGGAISRTAAGVVYDREQCTHCFQCANVCYFGARKVSARRMTVDKAFSEVMKDESFYRNSNGGLTLSGGEP